MKYEVEIKIDRSREEVVSVFQDPDQIKAWQPSFRSLEVIEGEPGATGSKTRLVYERRGKETEMIETITNNSLPERFESIYEAKGVKNIHENRFAEDRGSTRWYVETEFQFSGFMKIVALFLRKAFPKETRSSMELLKQYVESK